MLNVCLSVKNCFSLSLIEIFLGGNWVAGVGGEAEFFAVP